MARKSPGFTWYPDAWFGGTRRMNRLERSVYFDLLNDQWVSGGFSLESAKRLCNDVEPSVVDKVIKEKFVVKEDGLYYNQRLEEERSKQQKNREKQAQNGKKGGRPKVVEKPNKNPPEDQTETQSKTQPETQIEPKKKPSVSDSDSDSVLNTDSDTSHIPPDGVPAVADVRGPSSQLVRDSWNQAMKQNCQMTDKRKKALRARCRDPNWRENWQSAIARVEASHFCNGGGAQGWVANLDWFLRPDTVAKIIEGNYDSKTKGQAMLSNIANEMEAFVNGRG